MNISKIFRLLLMIVVMVFFTFVSQLYVNFKNSLIQQNNDLKIAIFLHDTQLDQEEILKSIDQVEVGNVVKFVDKQDSYQYALELNPELVDIYSQEQVNYPSYVLLNNPKASNITELENIKNIISSFDFVEDVCYDTKAYSVMFHNCDLLNKYTIIIKILLLFSLILFVLKIVIFSLKKDFRNIITNVTEGILVALLSYGIVCFCAIIKNSSLFILNWEILYFTISISIIINFLLIQPNAKN